jgi:hypothetical protein
LVTWIGGESKEGRVLQVQNHRVLVNRDGYSGGIWVDLNEDVNILPQIINLSVGTYGTLEKEQWLLNREILSKEAEIENEIYLLIKSIKENLKAEIAPSYADQIIQLKEFEEWYLKNSFNSAVTLKELEKLPAIFKCSVAREFLRLTPLNTIYHTFFRNLDFL